VQVVQDCNNYKLWGFFVDGSELFTYVVIVIGLFLVPGPAVLLVITRAIQGGRKIGIMTGLGIASGDLVHTLSAALGLSAILMTSSLAFNCVKWLGAAYLVYLGIRAFMAKPGNEAELRLAPVRPGAAYIQAVGAELLNPKTALFFLAFLPQFVHPAAGSTFMQFLILGSILASMSIVYTTVIVLTIRPLSRLFTKLARLRKWEGKIIGTIFVSLGLKIALQQQ
jgi:threonine/homoserine/homoserine lactone efflux protein